MAAHRSLSVALWLGACACLALSLLILDERGPRVAALVGYAVLQGASIALAERRGRPARWPLIVSGVLLAAVVGFWLGTR
jgi:hypothetical protein